MACGWLTQQLSCRECQSHSLLSVSLFNIFLKYLNKSHTHLFLLISLGAQQEGGGEEEGIEEGEEEEVGEKEEGREEAK